jgi:WD40 repeat protein
MLAFKPHKAAIFQVAFSPDGASIATCGTAPIVCVSDALTGKASWRSDDGPTIGLGMAYSPGGTRLAIVSWDVVGIYDSESGETQHTCPGRGYAVAFTPDGSSVITGTPRAGNDAIRTNLQTSESESIASFAGIPTFNRLRYSSDGKFIAAQGEQDMILVDGRIEKFIARGTGAKAAGVGALVEWHLLLRNP